MARWDGVLVVDGSLGPVVWNLLRVRCPSKIALLAGETGEGFQDVTVEIAGGIFGRFVAHDAVDQGVRCGLHC